MKFTIAVSTFAMVFVIYSPASAGGWTLGEPGVTEVLETARESVHSDAKLPDKSCNNDDLAATFTADLDSKLCKLGYIPTPAELENIQICSRNQFELVDKFGFFYSSASNQYGNMSSADKIKFCEHEAPVVQAWKAKQKPNELTADQVTNDISCSSGKSLALQVMTRFLNSTGTASDNLKLDNIVTTDRHDNQSNCVADIVMADIVVGNTTVRNYHLNNKVSYTVSLTNDKELYVDP
jgi:hypothetical protein